MIPKTNLWGLNLKRTISYQCVLTWAWLKESVGDSCKNWKRKKMRGWWKVFEKKSSSWTCNDVWCVYVSPPTLTSLWIWTTMFDTQLGTQPTPFMRYHETNRQTQPTNTNIIHFNQTHFPNYSSKFIPSLSLSSSFNSFQNYVSLFRSKQDSSHNHNNI